MVATEPHTPDPPRRGQHPGPDTDDLDLDGATEEFIRTARALVALAVRSVNAAPVEVTLMQHRVLVVLASRGEQSVNALADELGVVASNASRVCDRLQRLGLVARRRSSSDARSVKISITDDGRAVLASVHAHRRAEVHAILATMSVDDRRDAMSALRAFNDAAHEGAQDDWLTSHDSKDPREPGTAEQR